MYRIFLCSSSTTRRDDSDSACFGSRLSVTRFKDGARLQCVSLSRRCAARLHLYVWNERCRSLLTPSPRFVPIPVIARDASLARIGYLPSMLFHGSSADHRFISNKPSLHTTPPYCAHLSTRGKEAVETDMVAQSNPPNPTPPPPRKLASRSVGATSSLG